MWQIVKAEFKYVWYLILIVVMFMIAGFIIYFHVSERARLESILLPLSVAVILQVVIIRSIEKRDRFQALLPIPLRETAMARILLFVVPSVTLHVLYFVSYFLLSGENPIWQHDIFDIAMFFGLIMLGGAGYFIQHDLIHARSRKGSNPDRDVFILIALITIIFAVIPLALAPIWGFPGNFLRMLCFAAGCASLYPALIIYERRRSYIE